MLVLKLRMVGKKHQRTFRLVAAEKRSRPQNPGVEDLGWYNQHTDKFELNKERIGHWLSKGAQKTETVDKLLKKASIIT